MRVSVIDSTSKIFIFRNIYRCKSTKIRSPHIPYYQAETTEITGNYNGQRVQIFNGSSRNLAPSHTTRDGFMI